MWRLGLAAAIVAGSADRTVGQARVFDPGYGGFMVGIARRPFIAWLAAAAAWPLAAQAAKFEFAINLKAAKGLRLEVRLLALADEVIE
jgi:hypothetical protein